MLRVVGQLIYCTILAEISANHLTYVKDCTLYEKFACTDLFCFFFRRIVGSLMYLGQCNVEMLTGASAIQRTVERLSTEDAAKKFTTVSFKVTPQGMTMTDNERK